MNKEWSRLKGRKGFTLIELIMVVIIVGVLAAIALPQYSNFVQRARGAEAVNALAAIKAGENQFRNEFATYLALANAAAIAAAYPTGLGITLDTTNWTYVVTITGGTQFVATATRTAANGGTAGQTVILTYNSGGTSTLSGTAPR